jgi:hypothetical protein
VPVIAENRWIYGKSTPIRDPARDLSRGNLFLPHPGKT